MSNYGELWKTEILTVFVDFEFNSYFEAFQIISTKSRDKTCDD